jgi:hypothetical protein
VPLFALTLSLALTPLSIRLSLSLSLSLSFLSSLLLRFRIRPVFFFHRFPHRLPIDRCILNAISIDPFSSRHTKIGVFGIFPEGGSHDRTDLLPLKVGVALIAYSALERDGVSVPIIPVGLNYFRTHKWRGKCLVEYGDPVYIDPTTLPKYQLGGSSKRTVCNDLLDRIKDSMRSVIVTMPDYDSLQVVHTARRLYQRNSENTMFMADGKKEKEQDLLRRFAVGYKLLMSEANKQQAEGGNDGVDGDGNIIPQA